MNDRCTHEMARDLAMLAERIMGEVIASELKPCSGPIEALHFLILPRTLVFPMTLGRARNPCRLMLRYGFHTVNTPAILEVRKKPLPRSPHPNLGRGAHHLMFPLTIYGRPIGIHGAI